MAKARAILKRRKAVRNIKKITKTMQMIATAKFQKSLKRAVGTKPYTLKVRELVAEVARNAGDIDHPLLRTAETIKRAAVIVVTSNRGLAGAYNGNVIRRAVNFIREQQRSNVALDVYTAGKKGASVLKFQRIDIVESIKTGDVPSYAEIEPIVTKLVDQFVDGQIDAVYVVYMNFISTGTQRPDVLTLLPLSAVSGASDKVARDLAEKEAQLKAGALDAKRSGTDVRVEAVKDTAAIYEFSPDPRSLLDELLPLTIKSSFFQSFLDATTSEHVARMIAMKSATDAADKMAKALSMEANRARQTAITTELSEIMGGVEAMK